MKSGIVALPRRLPRNLLRRSVRDALLGALLLCALVAGLLAGAAPVRAQDAAPVGATEEPAPEPVIVPNAATGPEATLQGVTTRIFPTRDVFIASNQPNLNTANFVNLDVGWFGNYGATRTMIRFSVSSIPANARIFSAQLFMYLESALPANDSQMRLAGALITQSWSENTATWNNSAGLYNNQFTLGSVGPNPGWVSFNVTSQVQGWVNGQSNNGLMIIGDETPSLARSRVFSSRQQNNAQPYLLVNWQCDTLPPITTMNGLPQFSPGSFVASWGGRDVAPSGCTPSGIRKFAVQYRINGGQWVDWKSTTLTSFTFENLAGNGDRVDFREFASDNAGNVEATPSSPQATTLVDTQPPVVTMTPLPQFTPTANFVINWSGTDNLSGVKNYSVQYQVNGGPWMDILTDSTRTSFQVVGAQNAQVLGFRARGTDNVGNVGSWPPGAQTVTTIALFPTATVLPFNPSIIKPTSPVTTSFTVNWSGFTSPGTTITQYQIWYRYTDMNGVSTGWRSWNTFPGAQTSAVFPYLQLGLGNGLYDFEATATNNLGQTTPITGVPEASLIVDLGDQVKPAQYFPWIAVNK